MQHLFFVLLFALALILTATGTFGSALGSGIAAVVVLAWLVFIYNNLVTLSQEVQESWSDISIQLKRRADLIPNLLEAVKGYAKHEQGVFEKVTQARAQALNAQTIPQKAAAENALSGALKSLFAVAEAYPDLKANQNFLELQKELADTEDKVQGSRRFYNATVRELNTFLESFPVNVLGGLFKKFSPKEYFELEAESERSVPKVKF